MGLVQPKKFHNIRCRSLLADSSKIITVFLMIFFREGA